MRYVKCLHIVYMLFTYGSVAADPVVIPTAPIDIGVGDTSIITSDSLPYTLNTDDRVYILTANVHCSSSAITIESGTNRIILDGQGDTVFFGEDGSGYTYGIRVGYATSTTDIHIRNITFYHNPDDSLADSTVACCLCGGVNVLFDTVNFHVFGNRDTTNADWAHAVKRNSYFDRSLWSHMWRGGSWTAEIVGYESRMSKDGFVADMSIDAATLPDSATYHYILKDVNTYGVGGIDIEGRTWIEACSITVDARNLKWDVLDPWPSQDSGYKAGSANMSGLSTGEGWIPSWWIDNYIIGGYDRQGMDQGILIAEAGIQGNPDSSMTIRNNYVNAHFRKCPYYGIALHSKAFTSRYGNKHIIIDSNIFIVEAGDTNTDSAWGPSPWGVKYITGNQNDAVCQDTDYVFEHNYIEIVPKTATLSGEHFRGMFFSVGDGMDSAGYDPIGAGVFFRNNHIKTPEWAYTMGGSDGGCQYMMVDGDTVEFFVSDASIKQYLISCQHGASGAGNYNFYNYAQDVIYTGTGEPDSLVLLISGYGDHSAGIKRTLTIYVKGYDKNPMNGADVWAVNAYGDTVISTTTNVSGIATGVVKYWDIYSDFTDSTAYNNFTLGAQKSGDSATTTFTVAWNNHTDTLELTASAGKSKRLRGVK